MTAAEFVYTVLLRPRPLRLAANWALRLIIKPELRIHGCVVALNPNDPVVSGALMLGAYEKAETRLFRTACRPGMIVLDVGANVGYYTALAMRALGPDGVIIAMEPDPDSFSYLQKTVAANGNARVTCVPMAAAGESGEATLFISRHNRGDNRLYANEFGTESLTVQTVTVDDLLKGLGIDKVNLVKIDVQGFEGHVLGGMQATLAHSSPLIIMMEFWPHGLRSAGFEPERIFTLCERLNLRIFKTSQDGKLEVLKDPAALIRKYPGRKYTNLVAVRGADFLDELIARDNL